MRFLGLLFCLLCTIGHAQTDGYVVSDGKINLEAGFSTGLLKDPEADYGVTFVHFKPAFLDHDPLPKEFDLREYGYVSPVRNQGGCGSCWAFSTVDSMESSMLMFGMRGVNLSQQHLVNCQFSGCGGGYFGFDWIKKSGITDSQHLGYSARNGRCNNDFDTKYSIDSWWRIGSSGSSPSMDDIKAAMYHFGGISVTVASSGLGSGGNVSSCRGGGTDHMVTLVGWTQKYGEAGKGDAKWIMKNSWGQWGDKGYAYVGHLCARLGEDAAVSLFKGVPVSDMIPAVKLPAHFGEDKMKGAALFGEVQVPEHENATYTWFVNGRVRAKGSKNSFKFNKRFTKEVRVKVENDFAVVESQMKVP